MCKSEVIKLTWEESSLVERLNYIWQSEKMLVEVLARQLGDSEIPEAKAMLEDACAQCKSAYLALRVAQDEVLAAHLGPEHGPVQFTFDFRQQEVMIGAQA